VGIELSHPAVSNKLRTVVNTLRKEGINFPLTPHGKPFPGQWLVRGELQDQRLLGRETHFRPNPGRDETFGVFFGDNAAPLMDGILYVYPTDRISDGWLINNSPQMKKLLEEIAERHFPRLRLDTYGGYVTAASELYKINPVYDPRSGIATAPHPIPVNEAHVILVEKPVFEINQDRIPPHLRDKVIPFDYH
jgi:hypothetical protein